LDYRCLGHHLARIIARTERSISYWSRVVADLKHEKTRAIQPPLWPEEETKI
jgi:hypothetical protein